MVRTGVSPAAAAVQVLGLTNTVRRVLEIGFGPGVGLAALAQAVPAGHVTGVDPAQVMHQHAARRNQKAISEGRVPLI